jgi:hypothetical protein
MKLSLNLRGDLAKLTDAELAERLEHLFHAYEAAQGRKTRWWDLGFMPVWRWRGPIRHPRAYRFFASLAGASGGSWLDLVFAIDLSDKRAERLLRSATDPQGDIYLHLCEIRDIMDEAERRIAQRQGQPS